MMIRRGTVRASSVIVFPETRATDAQDSVHPAEVSSEELNRDAGRHNK